MNGSVVHPVRSTMSTRAKASICLGAIIVVLPITARADAIIPYMVVPWGQVFLLPLVVLVESVILYRLAGGRFLSATFQSLIANVVSTALGAALYVLTMPLLADHLFEWWFKGELGSEAIRNASIALGFAVVLWGISWASETTIVARLRRITFKTIGPAMAWANLLTYLMLVGLALWLQH